MRLRGQRLRRRQVDEAVQRCTKTVHLPLLFIYYCLRNTNAQAVRCGRLGEWAVGDGSNGRTGQKRRSKHR